MARKRSSRSTKRTKRSFTTPVVVVLIVVALIAGAMNYHFVVTKNGFKVLKKSHWGPKDTFVDTRSWGPLDWIDHSDLLKAMVNNTINNLKDDVK